MFASFARVERLLFPTADHHSDFTCLLALARSFVFVETNLVQKREIYRVLKDRGGAAMALEWAALGAVTAAEALILLLLTMPGLTGMRRGLIAVARTALQPLLAVVPLALFLMLEIYWKYEHLPECSGPMCSVAEKDRHSKSVIKSQRNAILVAGALLLYWVLYRITAMLVRMEKLDVQLQKLKDSE